jgi:hypothetical protein
VREPTVKLRAGAAVSALQGVFEETTSITPVLTVVDPTRRFFITDKVSEPFLDT